MNLIIERVFDVCDATISRVVNAPFVLSLSNGTIGESGHLSLDADSLNTYNIPFSLDLIRKRIKVTFEEVTLSESISEFGELDTTSIQSSDLSIVNLSKHMSISFDYPDKRYIEDISLNLVTYGYRRDYHFGYIPCPLFEFSIKLSDEEFNSCKLLLPNSIFRVSFQLLEG